MRELEPTGGCWMQTTVQGEEWSGTQGSLNSLVTWSGLVFELELVPLASHHLAIQYCCPINHQSCITLFYLFRLRSQQICRYHENGAFPLCFQWMIADLPKAEPGLNFLISTVCVTCLGDLIPVQHSAGIGISPFATCKWYVVRLKVTYSQQRTPSSESSEMNHQLN